MLLLSNPGKKSEGRLRVYYITCPKLFKFFQLKHLTQEKVLDK